jgi:DNA/RNA-binding domain of Phe-tRNA-synthetase-like protein
MPTLPDVAGARHRERLRRGEKSAPMLESPFAVNLDLAGWALLWARLELAEAAGEPAAAGLSAAPPAEAPGAPVADGLAALRRSAAARARLRHALAPLSEHPTAAAVRALFRTAGCDPTRYRPSSEALLRRVLKGEELPPIHPLVDLNNCLSIELAVPCSVAVEGSFAPPVTLRAGGPGETYESLRGPFNLEGKPLLADLAGPFSTPITDSQRGKVRTDTRRAWLVAYLPAAVLPPEAALTSLEALLRDLPAVRLELAAASPGDPRG